MTENLIDNYFPDYFNSFSKMKVSNNADLLQLYDKMLENDLGLDYFKDESGKKLEGVKLENKIKEYKQDFFTKMGMNPEDAAPINPLLKETFSDELLNSLQSGFDDLLIDYSDNFDYIKENKKSLGSGPDNLNGLTGKVCILEDLFFKYLKDNNSEFFYLDEIVNNLGGNNSEGRPWRDSDWRKVGFNNLKKKVGYFGETRTELFKAIIYSRLSGEKPKWSNYFAKIIDSNEEGVLSVKELKALLGVNGDEKINYYSINKMISIGVLERVDRGKYRIKKPKSDKADKIACVVNLFNKFLTQYCSDYLEPIRNYDLLSEDVKSSANAKVVDFYMKIFNSIGVLIETRPSNLHKLVEKIRYIDDVAKYYCEQFVKGIKRFGSSFNNEDFLRYESRMEKIFDKKVYGMLKVL